MENRCARVTNANAAASVVEGLAFFAATAPGKTALVVGDEKTSYGELYASVRGFCGFLRGEGIRKGDFVICRAAASAAYWIAYLGVQLAGGIFVPLEKDCTAETVSATADSLGGVFALVSAADDAALARRCGCVFVREREIKALAASSADKCGACVFPESDDVGQIIFTTGTTGKAKGVMLQHKYITGSAFMSDEIPYGPDTVMVLCSPMNHILSIGRCTSVLLHGGTVVLLDGLTDLGGLYAAFARHKANAMALTPSALAYIIALSGDEFVKYAAQIAFIEIGGEKLPRRRQTDLIALLPGVRMFNMYGSTENGATCYYEFSKYGATENRIGKPERPTEIIFLDDCWRERAATRDDPAFIAVRSDRQMKGYWRDAAATDKVKRGNLIMMSDYGYRDEEGFVCLSGRAGDVIISGGHKINPTEVENAALESSCVAECVCVGQKDAVFGNLVKLLVVVKEGEKLDKAALKKYLVGHLESFKVPRIIELTEKIKRNGNGKIDRRAYTE